MDKSGARPQAACLQVEQVHSAQAQFAHESVHEAHWHTLWLHVEQVQLSHAHIAQASEQSAHSHVVHSS